MVLGNTLLPLYHQLLEIFRENLDDYTWRPGEMIPTEKSLAEEYNVSLTTVRRALSTLEMEGKIIRKQGKGTYVSIENTSQYPVNISDTGLFNFAKQTSTIKVLKMSESQLVKGKKIDGPIVHRIYLENDSPYCLHTVMVDKQFEYALEGVSHDNYRFSETIIKNMGGYESFLIAIEAAHFTSYEAQLFGVQPGANTLLYQKTYYKNKTPVLIEKFVFKYAKLFSSGKAGN